MVDGWYGLFGPGGMDPAVTEKIAGTIRKGLSDPSAKKLVQGQGAEAVGNTPREFATFLSSEQGKWSQVIKQANITAQ